MQQQLDNLPAYLFFFTCHHQPIGTGKKGWVALVSYLFALERMMVAFSHGRWNEIGLTCYERAL